MIKYYLSGDNGLKEMAAACHDDWICVTSPTETEIGYLSGSLGLDADVLRSALDEDERSRLETDEGYAMILVNIPTLETDDENELYSTIPLAIIHTGDHIITVCSEDTPVLKPFAADKVKDFRTGMRSRFTYNILYRTASLFLRYLHIIDKKSDAVETKLHKSTQNRELIELLRLEKSLVYFTTSLRSNEAVMEKLMRTNAIKKYPEDDDLLEDVIVENKQAIEMSNIYSGILSGMMDAFASVISNNLNIVMKILAIVTIVLSIPTMIFSAYGMNLSGAGMPLAGNPYGFFAIVGLSLVLSLIVAVFFIKSKMFK
jgi:magnesium transporter